MAVLLEYLSRRYGAGMPVRILGWDEVRTVALLIAEPVNKHEVDRWIAESGKHVEVFYLQQRARAPLHPDWTCITKKDIRFPGVPKAGVTKRLGSGRFDMLINTNSHNGIISTIVSSAIAAGYRCTADERIIDAHLLVARTQPAVHEYLREVVRYLKMIRPARAVADF